MRGSARMAGVQLPVIPLVAELIRQNPGTISLGQGVVHYGPPPEALDSLAHFLADPNNHKYKPVQGIPPLLEAIEAKLESENNIRVRPKSEAVVTAGGNMAFQAAILAVADPGDEVILQTPYYFNHEMALGIAGCRPVLVPTDDTFQLDPAAIRAAVTDRTKAVVTVSPNNPTGAVYPEAALREVNGICRDYGLFHIHDEAYEYFTWDSVRHFSPGSIGGASANTISLYSLSKAYGFASWRIGYMVIPERLLTDVKKILDTVLICPPVISQFAAVGALNAGAAYCREKLESIGKVRRLMLDELSKLDGICTVPAADGAFYFLLRINSSMNSMTLVERLICRHRVAAMPGSTFGVDNGCYLRVAYGALIQETAEEGIGRLVNGLKTIVGSG